MRKIATKVLVGCLCAAFVVPFAPAGAEESQPVAKRRSTYAAIQDGKELLENRLDALRDSGRDSWLEDEQPYWAEVFIASWNRETDSLRLTKINKSGRQVRLLEGAEPVPRVTYSKQLYSMYAYSDPEEIVVGVLYPRAAELDSGSWKMQYVYYVPMINALYTPDVIAAGSDYLTNVIRRAYAELDELGVMSVSFPDQKLSEVIDPYLIKSIVIIEHSSHIRLLSDFQPEKEMGEFLAYLGLNGGTAFGSTLSSAGARGLAQFIPSTYRLMVSSRPSLQLIPDFSAGMADHVNAIKAASAYLDGALAEMPAEVKRMYIANRQTGAPFLAAAYNGGPARVRWAVNEWGVDEWAEPHQMSAAEARAKYQEWRAEVNRLEPLRLNTADRTLRAKYETQFWNAVRTRENYKNQIVPLSKASLRTETVYYVKKLNTVYQMLVSGYYATPDAPNNAIGEETAEPSSDETVPQGQAVTEAPDGLEATPVEKDDLPELSDMVICFDGDGCFK